MKIRNPKSEIRNRRILVSMPVADTDPLAVVPGSTVIPCVECGEKVWLSPSSRRAGFTSAICRPCAAVKHPQPTDFEIVPGMLEEFWAGVRRLARRTVRRN